MFISEVGGDMRTRPTWAQTVCGAALAGWSFLVAVSMLGWGFYAEGTTDFLHELVLPAAVFITVVHAIPGVILGLAMYSGSGGMVAMAFGLAINAVPALFFRDIAPLAAPFALLCGLLLLGLADEFVSEVSG
jgi:hypothetical protein